MFHYADTVLSTGEPPTESSVMSSQQETGADFAQVEQDSTRHQQRKTDRDASKLVPQEPDSGYEASPSSTNDVCTFNFEGSQNDSNAMSDNGASVSRGDSQPGKSEDCDDFEDCSSPILMDYPSDDQDESGGEEDLADSGDSDEEAEDSLLTRRWPGESQSIHVTSQPEVENDQGRPSSLPIPIPIREEPARLHATFPRDVREAERLYSQSLPSPISTSAISSPAASPQMPHLRVYVRLPFSWPFVYTSARPDLLMTGRRTNLACDSANGHRSNRPSRSTWNRSRRRLIDSDASSFSSSDSEGPEEVFDDSSSARRSPFEELLPLVSSAPSPDGQFPLLPDVVPHSACMGNSNGVRRSRSVSVSLPLDREQEQTAVQIGRTLRRLSDQFANEISLRRAPDRRRYTVSEMVRLTLHTLDHRPPRPDSDDDSDGHPVANHVRRS